MAHLDRTQKTLALKLLYWGPEGAGKTTNLVQLHRSFPKRRRGRLVKLDTEREQAHFFEYFPASLGRIGEHAVRVDYLTAPAQPTLTATRRALLHEADAVVFVADSALSRQQHNLDALSELRADIASVPRNTPVVFQWNRRDARRCVAVEQLERILNPESSASQAAIASAGVGVWQTQLLALDPLVKRLRARLPKLLSALRDDEQERSFPLDDGGPRPQHARPPARPRPHTVLTPGGRHMLGHPEPEADDRDGG